MEDVWASSALRFLEGGIESLLSVVQLGPRRAGEYVEVGVAGVAVLVLLIVVKGTLVGEVGVRVEGEVGELRTVDGTAVGVDGENAADVFCGLGGEVLIDKPGLVAGESAVNIKTIASQWIDFKLSKMLRQSG
ncbi:hypothetical protein [Granulicella sp. dw_53]|uniref:hypothetical protein n=1 Tax=Granulicella sp. dw_53 TaxID=2719792 RepID=UPI001BD583D8|nr:hypothetical protein [Granulicella sp. dw_53]